MRAAVVARLIRARLLSASDDTVAVTHELLALAWPRLHDWLEEDSAGARLLGKLTVAADAWEADGERDEDLYRGARLQNALDWRSASKPDLTSTESRFLDAAEHRARREEAEARTQLQRDRRQNRRLRVLFGATASLLGISLLGTILVVGATQEADRQREAAVVEATSARRSRCAGPSATSPHSSPRRRTGDGQTTRELGAPCSASSPPRRDSSGTGTCPGRIRSPGR